MTYLKLEINNKNAISKRWPTSWHWRIFRQNLLIGLDLVTFLNSLFVLDLEKDFTNLGLRLKQKLLLHFPLDDVLVVSHVYLLHCRKYLFYFQSLFNLKWVMELLQKIYLLNHRVTWCFTWNMYRMLFHGVSFRMAHHWFHHSMAKGQKTI